MERPSNLNVLGAIQSITEIEGSLSNLRTFTALTAPGICSLPDSVFRNITNITLARFQIFFYVGIFPLKNRMLIHISITSLSLGFRGKFTADGGGGKG